MFLYKCGIFIAGGYNEKIERDLTYNRFQLWPTLVKRFKIGRREKEVKVDLIIWGFGPRKFGKK